MKSVTVRESKMFGGDRGVRVVSHSDRRIMVQICQSGGALASAFLSTTRARKLAHGILAICDTIEGKAK